MQLSRWTLAGCLIAGLAGCGSPSSNVVKPSSAGGSKSAETSKPEASNKDKILGVWELTKASGDNPPGTTAEFTKDGKLKLTAKVQGKEMTMNAEYSLDGDKLTQTMLGPDGKPMKGGREGKEMKETMTIVKLTDTELVTKDSKDKIDEFKKKK